MDTTATLTRSQLRLGELINIGRPLTEDEQDELYRALHADYMRKWRLAKLDNEMQRHDLAVSKPECETLLVKLRLEALQP